jgi:hypothetical protein
MLNFYNILNKTYKSFYPLDTALLKAHAILFTSEGEEHFKLSSKKFLNLANKYPERVTVHIAIINITAMLGYALKESFLRRCIVKGVNTFKNA